jgi:hypothetical protein
VQMGKKGRFSVLGAWGISILNLLKKERITTTSSVIYVRRPDEGMTRMIPRAGSAWLWLKEAVRAFFLEQFKLEKQQKNTGMWRYTNG